MSQEDEFKEMIDKLPPKLGDMNNEELRYKFLYCWGNNQTNQANQSAQQVHNSIINSSDIENNITFDIGFIINAKPVKKGGSSDIPTQKRRPNRKRKSSHTIKDRAKTR